MPFILFILQAMSLSVYSAKRYIEYRPGDTNLILTIPHGGGLRPAHIPNRDAGGYVNGTLTYSHDEGVVKDHDVAGVRFRKDTYTQELGLLLSDEINILTGRRPHVILCHLYRGKLDVNCDIEKAAFCVEEMEGAWHAWHGFINEAKSAIEERGNRGLMLDVHGHTHTENWVELGYTLTAQALNTGSMNSEDTSIHGLLVENSLTSPKDILSVLSGEQSLGALIQEEGYKVIPSPKYPTPGSGNYYTGGFNTLSHGSHNGGHIDAIQLENPKYVRNSKAGPAYASALARAITTYLDMFYSNR